MNRYQPLGQLAEGPPLPPTIIHDRSTVTPHTDIDGRRLSAMAWITGTLRRVHEVAASVSLAAMNARVIAARAGASAVTFVPITHAVDVLARDVGQVVGRIEKSAVTAAQSAARAYIVKLRAERFVDVRRRLGNDDGRVLSAAWRFNELVETHARSLRANGDSLLRELDRVDALLRASLTLSTLSRVEAARAATHRLELAAIGDSIDQAAETIRSAVVECRERLIA